jgi:uncharacterized protein (DUF305 family)
LFASGWSLATSVAFMATSFALAQDSMDHSHSRTESGTLEQQFLFANDLAISSISREMLARPTGDVDHDFVDVIIPHHQGTIDLARGAQIRSQQRAPPAGAENRG